MSPLIVSI